MTAVVAAEGPAATVEVAQERDPARAVRTGIQVATTIEEEIVAGNPGGNPGTLPGRAPNGANSSGPGRGATEAARTGTAGSTARAARR